MHTVSSCMILLFSTLAMSCRPKDPCALLKVAMSQPLYEPTDREYCESELKNLTQEAKPFGSVQKWKETVFDQSNLLITIMENVVNTASAPPIPFRTFPRFPAKVPCGDGVEFSNAAWGQTPLGELGIRKPERLYYS